MPKLTESSLETTVIEICESVGYHYISPEQQEIERGGDTTNVVLTDRLRAAIDRLNPTLHDDAKAAALSGVLSLPTDNMIENNRAFHRYLTDGVRVSVHQDGETRGVDVQIIDTDTIENNDFVVSNQVSVRHGEKHKIPDVVLFVNGLPMVVLELKNPADEKTDWRRAYTQLQNYKSAIPSLFYYNALLVASDGLDARAGSLTAGQSRFMAWRSRDGEREDSVTMPEIETLVHGALTPASLLDIATGYTLFDKRSREDAATGQTVIETIKIVAAYHQYYAVKKAVDRTVDASHTEGDKKAGVVWHTQGSGKSLSMVFYAGRIVQQLDNPTLVIITDRNDLDDQLFDTFGAASDLLRQTPQQATSRAKLKELLTTSGGGVIFTTIQKFSPDDDSTTFDTLSERDNIVVIADEAHRSQYGFDAKTTVADGKAAVRYGFAKYLRDALPNASFIGFTGTPIESEDKSTPAVFGDYIDVYDIEQAVADGATVRIFYESRLAKVNLKDEEKELLDAEVSSITESEESTAAEKAKAKWTQLEAIVGHPDRIDTIADDIVTHFEQRQQVFEGKGMIVSMSRRIAVELYEAIIKRKPEWDHPDLEQGAIKVVMTSTSSDPENWQQHHTTKQDRKRLAERMRDPNDPLRLVIVRDMWLTGFDAPCLHTLYVDKPMRGHNLMQAIARVNRVFKDKPGGLVVDYIGIAGDLKRALATYTESGGTGTPTLDIDDAVAAMLEKYEVVEGMFADFDYAGYASMDTRDRLELILEAQEHILALDNGRDRLTKEVGLLSKAFALTMPHPKAITIQEDVAFFQAVKARLVKFEPRGSGKSDVEIETAIRQIVDRAVVSEGIIDIFDAAGMEKPDLSILSDEFLAEVRGMERKNLALELLKKILNDEISTRKKKNMVQSKKLSEMLEMTIRKYHNNLLTAAEVIDELITLAKDVRAADGRGEDMGLSYDELAFYDALANNESAREVIGDETLREIARILVEKVRGNATIDWQIRDSVRAKLRVLVKRTLNTYGYPPDEQKIATENILKQAELFADEWSDRE